MYHKKSLGLLVLPTLSGSRWIPFIFAWESHKNTNTWFSYNCAHSLEKTLATGHL